MIDWKLIVDVTIVLFLFFCGSSMNVGFIGSFHLVDVIKKTGSAYHKALGFSDLIITLVVMPLCTILMIKKEPLNEDLCNIVQLFTEISTNSHNLLTMLLAADNYFRAYPGCRLSSLYKGISTSLAIPIVALISTIIEIVGIYCELNFDYCDVEQQGSLYFRVAVNIFVHFLPAVISLALLVIAAKKARMPTAENRIRYVNAKETLHVAITDLNIITYLLYIICWIPCVLVTYTNPDSTVFKYVIWIGMVRSAFGNSIYIIFNKHFRRGFTILFKFVCCPILLGFIDHPPDESSSSSEELSLHVLRPRPAQKPRMEEEELY